MSNCLSDSTLESGVNTKPHWCQRGGHRGPGAMLGCQKANSQHGLLREAARTCGKQGRSNGVYGAKPEARGRVGMGTVQTLINQQSRPHGAGFRFLASP